MDLDHSTKRYLTLLGKLILLAGCVVYLLKGVDPERLITAISRYHYGKILLVLFVMTTGFVLMGVRLWDLAQGAVGLAKSVFAEFYGFFVNNVLPARLGEMAKIVYLCKEAGIEGSQGAELVFWERFADLNVFLFLVVFGAFMTGTLAIVLPFGALALLIWGLLIYFFLRPHKVYRFIRIIPGHKVEDFVRSFLGYVQARTGSSGYAKLGLFSLLIWLEHMLEILLIIYWISGFDLSWTQGFVVFALALTGLSIPLAPAGLGVADSAIVFSLGLYGVGHSEALAASLVWRFLQFAITVATGLIVMFRYGAGLKDVLESRKKQAAVDG
ncbi:MAG: flippase-like domain-containing protein [Desulfohalobiaceae bacterium]|nr:flippase-like domain-containing protein [Desulfohalobiaceae bacterium]